MKRKLKHNSKIQCPACKRRVRIIVMDDGLFHVDQHNLLRSVTICSASLELYNTKEPRETHQ